MAIKIKKIFYVFIVFFILYSIYLSAFFVLKGEIAFTNDIGRNFLLLQELDYKKIVLIGPRTNFSGVFHGIFWTYLNYPAYLIGNGDPIVVEWFWVILGVIFLITTFLIVRNLFNFSAALLATAAFAAILIPRTFNIFGAEATFYFMPCFLYTIYKYIQTKKLYFLVLHIIITGLLMQLNIGVGGLFAMLSIILGLFFIYKNKLWNHILSLLFLPLMLLNFIIFDMRHGFHMLNSLLNLAGSSKFQVPFSSWLENRLHYMISMQLYIDKGVILSLAVFLAIMLFTYLEIKKNSKQQTFFKLLIFYYFGYFLFSYFHKGIFLTDYAYLLAPISIIWLAALIKGPYKIFFIPLVLIIIFINFQNANNYLYNMQNSFIGKSPDSWISLKNVAQGVINLQKNKEFGYYVYSPDSYAYQQRYAMLYNFNRFHAKALEYVKKDTTYIIAAPPPSDKPYMGSDWWIKNEAKILILPVQTIKYQSGYTVERFALTQEEQKVAHDPNIELRLHFR